MNHWPPTLLCICLLLQCDTVSTYNMSKAELTLVCYHGTTWSYDALLDRCFYIDMNNKQYQDRLTKCATMYPYSEMAAPQTKFENNQLCKYIKKMHPAQDGDKVKLTFWIGATDSVEEGVYRWNYNQQPVNAEQSVWGPGQPNDNSDGNCLALIYEQKDNASNDCLWNDGNCEDKGLALCEIREPNPCVKNNGGCLHICVLQEPRHSVCMCRTGYTQVRERFCQDVDECDGEAKGGCVHDCINHQGGYKCRCHSGYEPDGNYTCQDIDECTQVRTCDQLCTNHNGSYRCDCVEGYEYVDDFTCIPYSIRKEIAINWMIVACVSVILSIFCLLVSCCINCRKIPPPKIETPTPKRKKNFQTEIDKFALYFRNQDLSTTNSEIHGQEMDPSKPYYDELRQGSVRPDELDRYDYEVDPQEYYYQDYHYQDMNNWYADYYQQYSVDNQDYYYNYQEQPPQNEKKKKNKKQKELKRFSRKVFLQ